MEGKILRNSSIANGFQLTKPQQNRNGLICWNKRRQQLTTKIFSQFVQNQAKILPYETEIPGVIHSMNNSHKLLLLSMGHFGSSAIYYTLKFSMNFKEFLSGFNHHFNFNLRKNLSGIPLYSRNNIKFTTSIQVINVEKFSL